MAQGTPQMWASIPYMLIEIWDRPVALSDVEDPEAWWEIPSQGALARKVRRYYPLLRPVVDQPADGASRLGQCSADGAPLQLQLASQLLLSLGEPGEHQQHKLPLAVGEDRHATAGSR